MDGLFLTGGKDISPIHYKDKPSEKLEIQSPFRDEFELRLYKKAKDKKIPILGICRGMQLMNIAEGGTLYQAIIDEKATKKEHAQSEMTYGDMSHKVNLIKETKLFSIINQNNIDVNSIHHQSLKIVSKEFIISARSEDGLVEGIESVNQKFAIGVQWHPEWLYSSHEENKSIFNRFIEECTKRI